jgi:hypothetical protein
MIFCVIDISTTFNMNDGYDDPLDASSTEGLGGDVSDC